MPAANDASLGMPAPSVQPLDAAELQEALERISNDPDFSKSRRTRDFLRYVVLETLEGRAERIKAYSIAIEVLGRDSHFDAQTDPAVRIEAGRLRRALERYYLTAGAAETVEISIPKGTYVPEFRRRSDPAEAAVAGSPEQAPPSRRLSPRLLLAAGVVLAGVVGAAIWGLGRDRSPAPGWHDAQAVAPEGPSLLVRPLLAFGDDPNAKLYADGLSEEIVSQLARFREITVLRSETSQHLPAGALGTAADEATKARFVLEGSARVANGRFRVTARVIDNASAAVLWSQTYDGVLRSGDFVAAESDIAGKVATAVAQPYGIVFRADEQRAVTLPPDDLEAYGCTLRFYNYRVVLSSDEHLIVRTCLEQAVSRYPSYGTAWAMLSYLYVDEGRFEFNRKPGTSAPVERALEAARRAVQLDPNNVRALQALMTALFFNGQTAESLEVGEQALTLNPNDPELLGEFGSRLAQSGDWDRGSMLLERALDLNPGNSGFYAGMLALSAYMRGDTTRAVSLIRQADLKRFPLYHVVAALIYARAGMEAEAEASRKLFLTMRPHFFDNVDAELAKRNFLPKDRRILIEGAREAGFPVRSDRAG